jgi:hypothetical protein
MITAFGDTLDTLFNLQRALEARLASDWLQDLTTSRGPFPPINVFQQGDNILVIVELPGIDKRTGTAGPAETRRREEGGGDHSRASIPTDRGHL